MTDPLSVKCPNCWAPPHDQCMDGYLLPTGNTLFKQVDPHQERIDAANKLGEPVSPSGKQS